ncbi:MAG TPA: PhzF family phenazine biosynthesis protein [Candidatus Cloacimonadota bacterium]|nr:PhzF family phenazine biosynthesis protein [Candidatus Cloacimonadota bacterium]HPS38637.1 PhzF family phenazine biosynthesis protein [Candidatus Cloacimonadota bacterium]
MDFPVYFVNAFTTSFTGGNTAAVMIVQDYPEAGEMQAIAKFFGFSETAFLKQLAVNDYQIRWFTPEVEVPLCGHATLASAKCLFEFYHPQAVELTFRSLSGELSVQRAGQSIELNFPIDRPVNTSVAEDVLLAVVDVMPEEILFAPRTRNLVLIYPKAQTILDTHPDFDCLVKLKDLPFFGIAISASTGDDAYVCRYFAPWEGINEDPVTGSAQTFLAPYWANRLGVKELHGFQASARSGDFRVKVSGDRVLISGEAKIILKGSFTHP